MVRRVGEESVSVWVNCLEKDVPGRLGVLVDELVAPGLGFYGRAWISGLEPNSNTEGWERGGGGGFVANKKKKPLPFQSLCRAPRKKRGKDEK